MVCASTLRIVSATWSWELNEGTMTETSGEGPLEGADSLFGRGSGPVVRRAAPVREEIPVEFSWVIDFL